MAHHSDHHHGIGSGAIVATAHTKGIGKEYVRSCFLEKMRDDRFSKRVLRVYNPIGQIGSKSMQFIIPGENFNYTFLLLFYIEFFLSAPQDDLVDISNLIFEINLKLIDTATNNPPIAGAKVQ